MSDIDYVTEKLTTDYEKKRFAIVEVATGLSQRTMDNIVKLKVIPSSQTVQKLLAYYKPKKVKK